MADTVTTRVLHDGERYATVRLTNESDGTGEAAVRKVDISTLVGSPARVAIMRIKGATYGMGVKLHWDAATDVLAAAIGQDASVDLDYSREGGLQPPDPLPAGFTGDIMLTTHGHATGEAYDLTLTLKKKG